jgi:hypothetical protein
MLSEYRKERLSKNTRGRVKNYQISWLHNMTYYRSLYFSKKQLRNTYTVLFVSHGKLSNRLIKMLKYKVIKQ